MVENEKLQEKEDKRGIKAFGSATHADLILTGALCVCEHV